ncbi:MAG: GtrA family protein [Christensenellales bacterium]|jgi:glycosyltransferase involved in cell wall biosynthesis
MPNPMRIALIPAYEPTRELPMFVERLKAEGFSVVVVDDGSGAGYRDVFDAVARAAHVISYAPNRGKGHALKTGYAHIRDHVSGAYVIVTVDADGQHSVADALRVAEAAAREPDCLILGSRKFEGDVPARSLFGNRLTRFVFRMTTGVRVRDTQTGLRAFNHRLMEFMLRIDGSRYEYEMNVLLSCSRENIRIREIDIETIYIDDNASSHFKAIRDSMKIYSQILKFAASSFVGFLIDYALFSLLSVATAGMGAVSIPLSNVAARVVSASANYAINRSLIFKSKGGVVISAAQYAALAALILLGNTLLITFLTERAGVNRYLAKLLTEISLFFFSWLMQKHVIFREKR